MPYDCSRLAQEVMSMAMLLPLDWVPKDRGRAPAIQLRTIAALSSSVCD